MNYTKRHIKCNQWTKKAIVVLMACTALMLWRCSSLRTPGSPFSIIVLPDTQNYSRFYPQVFYEQTKWIKSQKNDMNIICVIHEGDITDLNAEREWQVADRAIGVLDDVVPVCMALGNHDLGHGGSARDRNAKLFNKYFGPNRYSDKPWHGGHFENSNENAYYFINSGKLKFLILCLEFGPRDQVLEWAHEIVDEHKDHCVIVVTHCFTYSDDTRVGKGDKWNPHQYGVRGNDGEAMWDKFVRKHKNIFLVLSGHILNDGLGRLTSIGDNGNKVHQILANYQMHKSGGNGWLRIMKFLPSEEKIIVTTYSPFLKEYATDAQNQFELEWPVKLDAILISKSNPL